MSSATSMVTPSAAATPSVGGGDDDVGCRACFGVVVACLSLLLFCILAGTVGVVKASAFTGLAVAFLCFVGWLALPVGRSGATVGAPRAVDMGAAALRLRRARQAFGIVATATTVRVPPAFAFECGTTAAAATDADAETGGVGGKPVSCVNALCAVCLEDVQRGEAVRRLPACGHLFHRDCVDMWLHSHTTCPLCRTDLVAPRNQAAKTVTTASAASYSDDAVAPQPSTNALPPV